MHRHAVSVIARAILLTVGLFVLYAPALRGDFLWDDVKLVVENPLIHAPDGLQRIWLSTQSYDYWPVTYTMFWLDWRCWGRNTLPYHLENLALHAAVALLIWSTLARLQVKGAYLIALLFAVHPVNVESVAWIFQRKTLLSTLFFWTALHCILKYEDSPGKTRWAWYLATVLSFVMALLSKTSAIMLPIVVLGLAYWRRRQIRRHDLMVAVPLLAIALALGGVSLWFQQVNAIGDDFIRDHNFAQRLAGAGWAVCFYFAKAVAPVGLTFVYPSWSLEPLWWASFLPLAIVALTFGTLAVCPGKLARGLLWGLGFYVVMLAPVLGFVDIYFMRYSLVADHWQYPALVAPIAAVVSIGDRVIRSLPRARLLSWLAAAAAVVILAALTWQQCHIYRSHLTLWSDTVRKNPKAWMAWNNLGVTYRRRGVLDQAIYCYRRSLKQHPNHPEAHNNLGFALVQKNELARAEQHYRRALELKPDYTQAHNNLGVLLEKRGLLSEALAQYDAALQIDSTDADAHNNAGNVMAKLGQHEQAAMHYRKAIAISPGDAKPYCNLARLMADTGKSAEAIQCLRQVVRLQPYWSEQATELAWMLATDADERCRHPKEAIGLLERVRRQTGIAEPRALDCLAAAYAATGRFEDAVAVAQQALHLARVQGNNVLARRIAERIEGYRAGRPFHELRRHTDEDQEH